MLNAKVMKSLFESKMNPGCSPIATSSIRPHVQRRAGWPKRAAQKSEKSEKWFLAVFQLQHAAAQLVPTKNSSGHFSDFSKNFRGYTGGVRNGRIMKAELRNRDRCPNSVVKSAQLRFARLPNQTPSQSVAVSRSDFGSNSNLAAAIEPFLASRIPLCV